MLDVIRESWGWIGLEPAAIQATNDFGNVIVRHADGTYWRIYPEEPSCNLIARTEDEYAALWQGDRIFPREFLMFGVWAGARLSFLC